MFSARNYLEHRYGVTAVRLSGGHTNGAYRLATDPPSVVKLMSAARSEGRAEASCLRLLGGTGIAPELYEESVDGDTRLVRMSLCAGVSGQDVLDAALAAGDADAAYALYAALGAAAARIHGVDIPAGSGLPEYAPEAIVLPDCLPAPLAAEARRVTAEPVSERRVLAHGDFGPHNVLVGEGGVAVLDWEWASAAPPAADVGWLHWFTRLHNAPYAGPLLAAFDAAYAAAGGSLPAFAERRAVCTAKVCEVCARALGAAPEDRAEWARRFGWTLGLSVL